MAFPPTIIIAWMTSQITQCVEVISIAEAEHTTGGLYVNSKRPRRNLFTTYETRCAHGTPTSKVPSSPFATPNHPSVTIHKQGSWPWLIDSHPFLPMPKARSFIKYGCFKIWLWQSKVQVIGVAKYWGEVVGPAYNWFTSISFHITLTTQTHDTAISKFHLEILRWRSMMRLKSMSRSLPTVCSITPLPFCFTFITPLVPEIQLF